MDLEPRMSRFRTLGWKSFLGVAGLALLGGCAQVGSPAGGPKDETPPQLLETTPPIGATQVRPERLVLRFDEYVKAGQWRPQLLVSPPLEGPMDVVVRGREVELTWEAELRENTTYVFQFGDGVVDVNEGNPAQNLVHAFSTGPHLDTLAVTGTVRDGMDGSPEVGSRVLLYPEDLPLDSVLAGVAPQFVGVTNDQGQFSVGYLPNGAYRVLAVEDANRNYAWDAGERAAVGPVNARAGDTVALALVAGETPGPRAPYLSEARWDSTGFVTWKLSERLLPGDSLSWVQACSVELLEADRDVIRAWGWSEESDSLVLQLVWHHAPLWPKGGWWTDTVDVPAPRMTGLSPIALKEKPLGRWMPDALSSLTWSAPVAEVDVTRFALTVDSVPLVPMVEGPFPSMKSTLGNPELLSWNAEVALTVLPGALKRAGESEYNWPEDTLDVVWSTKAKSDVAEWVLRLEGVDCPGLLELADHQGVRLDVVAVASDTVLTWPRLVPGKVRATWWGDLDGDGVWRDVDVPTWRAPEPVAKMEAVELRANWVVESSWRLDSTACGPHP